MSLENSPRTHTFANAIEIRAARAGVVRPFFPMLRYQLPGFVIGAYFVSIQFARSIDISFLILIAGSCVLLLTQPTVNYRLFVSKGAVVAALLLLSTMASSALHGRGFIEQAMPIAQLPGLLIFSIAILFLREETQIIPIVWAWLVALILCVWQFFAASYAHGYARSAELILLAAHPLFLAPNDVLMFAICLPLVIWYGQRSKNVFGSYFIILYSILLIALSELLLSRLALLAVGIAIFLPLARKKRGSTLLIFATSTAVLLALFLFFDKNLLLKMRPEHFERIRVWTIAWQMFIDSPWTGHGPGSFSALYDSYMSRLGLASSYGSDMRHMGWAHNLFFESAAEKGLLGLVAIVAYFFYLFGMRGKKLKRADDNFCVASGIAALLFLLAACFEISLLRVWVIYAMYLLLGLTAAFTHSHTSAVNS